MYLFTTWLAFVAHIIFLLSSASPLQRPRNDNEQINFLNFIVCSQTLLSNPCVGLLLRLAQ